MKTVENKVLIVVDMQKDFVTGALGTPEAQSIVPLIEAKLRAGGYDKILFTFDTHYADYLDTFEGKRLPVTHCIKGTEGWSSALNWEFNKDIIVEKPTFGSLNWGKYIDTITKGRGPWDDEYSEEEEPTCYVTKSIEMCGVCTDICVISNALILKAKFPDIPITVDASCCAGTTPEAHKAALTVMKSCQIDVINE